MTISEPGMLYSDEDKISTNVQFGKKVDTDLQ